MKDLDLGKNENSSKGITLVALVITIIVLLILAGVTIVTLTGDNGLLQKAQTAKEENEEAKELELIKLAVSAAQVAGEGKLNTNNLKNELEKNLNDNDIDNNLKPIANYWNYKGYKINSDGNVEKLLLPKEYQQVEYIESTGTQYIDTGLLSKNYPDIFVEINGNFTNTNYYQYIFGAGFHNDYKTNCSWKLIGIIEKHQFAAQNGVSGKEKGIIAGDTQEHVFILDTVSSIGRIDQNSQVLDNNGVKPINFNYLLFAINNNGIIDRKSSFKMNSCKILENNQLIRYYIPCKSVTAVTNADGKSVPSDTKGLYDLVEGKFYTNANTAADAVDFIAGPDV